MENYRNLLLFTSYIVLDTFKKLNIRSLQNYQFITMICGCTPWIPARIHDFESPVNGGVCYKDITHSQNEAVVISKALNQFSEKKLTLICQILAGHLEYDQLDKLHIFMKTVIERSKDPSMKSILAKIKANMDILNKIREAEENKNSEDGISEDENDTEDHGYEAALDLITLFMGDDIYKGPQILTRKLDDESLDFCIEYPPDPITVVCRKELKDDNFMKDDIGNVVTVDVDNMYIFNIDDIQKMYYPYDLEFEGVGINEFSRDVRNGPMSVEYMVNSEWKGKRILNSDEEEFTDIHPTDLEYRFTVDEVSNIGFVYTLKPGRFVFGYTDNVIIEDICKSEHFIQHWKQREIEICMGFEEEDKIMDYLNMKQKTIKLENEKEEMKKIIDRLQRENNKLNCKLKKQANKKK